MMKTQTDLNVIKSGTKTFGALQRLLCKADSELTIKEFYQQYYRQLKGMQDWEFIALYLLKHRENTVGQEISYNTGIVSFFHKALCRSEA